MKEKALQYIRRAFIAAVVVVFLVIPLCLLIKVTLGFPPVIGNLLAARDMSAYAAQVYPDWTPESRWARYDLKNDDYWLSFSDGARSHSLWCSGGMVTDEARAEALEEELEITRVLRVNGLWVPDRLLTLWSVRWPAEAPDQPCVSVAVLFYDSLDAPVPDEASMRERMAEEAKGAYAALAPIVPIHAFSVRYCHPGVEGRHGELVWNTIQAELPEGEPLTREDILTGKLEVS